MKILNKLFGNIGLDINSLVDNVVTTEEERKSLKVKMKEVLKQVSLMLNFSGKKINLRV